MALTLWKEPPTHIGEEEEEEEEEEGAWQGGVSHALMPTASSASEH